MADEKLTALTSLASLTTDDLLYVVDDPAGTPISKSVAVSVLDARYQGLDATLTALAAYNTNGLLTQTAADTFAGRTLTAPAAGFTITNPAGIAGNPTFVLANDLSAVEGLATTGLAARTAADTWAVRTVTAGTGIGVTNGDGVSGNPTVAITDAELLALAGLTSAADALPYFTGVGTAAVTTLTSYIRGLLDDSSANAARSTLGVVIGTDVQAFDATLTAFAAYNTNGLLTQTAADTFTGRTLTAPAAGFTITNPAGIAGNPTFVLANDLAALEGLASTGFAARTGTDAWAQRTITAGNNISVTNGNGVAGNPTIAATAAGTDTQVQFNNGGTNFGGDAGLVYSATNDILSLVGAAYATISATTPGINFRVGNIAGPNFGFPGITWSSTDSSFTTENPKLVAGLITKGNENYTANTSGGSIMEFYIQENAVGATSSLTRALALYHDGTNPVVWTDGAIVRVNSTNAGGQVSIDQLDTAGGRPPIGLRQADVSEEFIRFTGTSANGVLTQSIVEDADVTAATRAGWVKVYVQDDGNQLTDQSYFLPLYTLA